MDAITSLCLLPLSRAGHSPQRIRISLAQAQLSKSISLHSFVHGHKPHGMFVPSLGVRFSPLKDNFYAAMGSYIFLNYFSEDRVDVFSLIERPAMPFPQPFLPCKICGGVRPS